MGSRREKMEMIIPSDFKYLGAVDAAVQDLARELSCAQRWINDFSAALIEACSNAIEHGNKLSKNKMVRVVVNLNGQQIVARVHDEGDGFDYKKYLSETSPPDPLSERGRGILIMKAFTDRLKYSARPEGGTCLELVKNCDAEAVPKAAAE
ncbi:MAG: ATP-binding protein [Candidatus Krumholzibacteria bacterium]|nr:ATP-binding protein [Candidatus Krumholzibacteria bacterium]